MKLKEVIGQSVSGEETSVAFEKIWEASQKVQIESVEGEKQMNKKINKRKIIAIAIIAATLSVTTLSAQHLRRTDDITYTFKNDKEVIGPWTAVDIVKEASDFNPHETVFKPEQLFLKVLDFKEDGTASMAVEQEGVVVEGKPFLKWSKGQMIHEEDRTNSQYTIKKIGGKTYMFYEWKSGDYSYRGQEPYIYVLEQGRHIETVAPQGKVDDTNVPFENDEAMKGTWVTVECVNQIEDFDSKMEELRGLPLEKLVLEDNGAYTMTTSQGKSFFDGKSEYWTKGAIVSKEYQTVSECVIKEIGEETYMFYGWKTGNYTVNGMAPGYFVLKKQ